MSKKKLRHKKDEIKAVVFDLGNVLLRYNAVRAALRFVRECEVPLTRVWLHFFTSAVEKAYTRGEISSLEFYRHAKKILRFPVDFKTFRHFWNDIFWENPGMENLLKRLKKHYPLYLITNTNQMHYNYIRKKFKLLRHFKRRFASHEVGCRKPEPEIYLKVLKAVRLRPEQTVFIDDVAKFVRGARKVGMHAVRFRNKARLVKDLKKLGVKTD